MRVRLLSGTSLAFALFIAAVACRPARADELFEREDNSAVSGAALLRLHEVGRGNITPIGDVDMWWVREAAVGDLVFAFADTAASSMGVDSVLDVFAHDTSTLLRHDDASGPGASAAVAGVVVTQPGNVFFVVGEGGANDVITPYRLHQAVISPVRSAFELEANDTAAAANIINQPIMFGHNVDPGPDLDYFKINVPANARVAVVVDDDPDRDGLLTDTDLAILAADGMTALAHGDDASTRQANAAGSIVTVAEGPLFIRIGNGLGGNDTDYQMVVFVNGIVYSDADADGSPDTDDNCPGQFNPSQSDSDGDGFGDACDACGIKTTPGDCGCDRPDVDINGDGVADCDATREQILATIGVLLVPDSAHQRIYAFDPYDGDYLFPFAMLDPSVTDEPIKAILSGEQASILVSDSKSDLVLQYDLNGIFIRTFAPAGGVNNSIMDGPGAPLLMPNGELLVGSGAGMNGHAVSRFDSAGAFLGNLIAPSAGSLSIASDILRRGGELLISDDSGAAVRVFDAAVGTYMGDFEVFEPSAVPQQIVQLGDGNILVASVSGARDRGVFEFDAAGTRLNQYLPGNVKHIRGVFELGNGNILISAAGRLMSDAPSTNGGVFVMNRAGQILETKLALLDSRLISLVKLDADGDGVGDALDECPGDPAKSVAGACGCGVADADINANGTADCLELPGGLFGGCCAPGVFPLVGSITPAWLLGWKARRRRKP